VTDPVHLASLVPLVHVASVDRATAFYARLGFAIRNTVVPDGGAEPVWAWLTSGEAQIMVAQADQPVDPAAQAVLFYLYCSDVPAFHEQLTRDGLAPGEIRYPFYCPRGEFRLVDPDGYVVMVTHT
jgi:hypothetical protein